MRFFCWPQEEEDEKRCPKTKSKPGSVLWEADAPPGASTTTTTTQNEHDCSAAIIGSTATTTAPAEMISMGTIQEVFVEDVFDDDGKSCDSMMSLGTIQEVALEDVFDDDDGKSSTSWESITDRTKEVVVGAAAEDDDDGVLVEPTCGSPSSTTTDGSGAEASLPPLLLESESGSQKSNRSSDDDRPAWANTVATIAFLGLLLLLFFGPSFRDEFRHLHFYTNNATTTTTTTTGQQAPTLAPQHVASSSLKKPTGMAHDLKARASALLPFPRAKPVNSAPPTGTSGQKKEKKKRATPSSSQKHSSSKQQQRQREESPPSKKQPEVPKKQAVANYSEKFLWMSLDDDILVKEFYDNETTKESLHRSLFGNLNHNHNDEKKKKKKKAATKKDTKVNNSQVSSTRRDNDTVVVVVDDDVDHVDDDGGNDDYIFLDDDDTQKKTPAAAAAYHDDYYKKILTDYYVFLDPPTAVAMETYWKTKLFIIRSQLEKFHKLEDEQSRTRTNFPLGAHLHRGWAFLAEYYQQLNLYVLEESKRVQQRHQRLLL